MHDSSSATLELPLSPEAYLEEREAIMRELCKTASPRPGAASLIERLHQHGVPLAIGTSSSRELCEMKLAPHAFSAHFRSVVCSDDPGISGGKPAPDIFLKAASELGAEPARCLVFEDTEKGMQAAIAAGMPVIVTPDPGPHGRGFFPGRPGPAESRGAHPAAAGLSEVAGLPRPGARWETAEPERQGRCLGHRWAIATRSGHAHLGDDR